MTNRALVFFLLLPATAVAQHPGHLGKKPPTRTPRVVPKWPRRPDPQPLRTSEFLDITVELNRGKLKVLSVKKGRFPDGARVLPRFRGRFEARLHAHGLLLDVVRFDLPLTAAAEDRPLAPPGHHGTALGDRLGLGLAKGVRARTRVRIPFTGRVTRVVVHDTLTRKKTRVDLSGVLPPAPRPRLPADLRTRSFGKPGPRKLEDSAVLKGARPEKPRKEPRRPKKPKK